MFYGMYLLSEKQPETISMPYYSLASMREKPNQRSTILLNEHSYRASLRFQRNLAINCPTYRNTNPDI